MTAGTNGPGSPGGMGVPGGREGPGFSPEDALFARRIVQVRGPLDETTAGDLAARLMYLDGSGDEAVTLYVDSPGGPLHAAFSVLDTIALLGVPVDTVCVGRAEGTAVAVVAAGRRRHAAPHARFRLGEPDVSVSGRADQLQSWATYHAEQATRLAGALAAATGRPAEHVEADLAAGRWLDAEQAQAYGIVDDTWPATAGRGRVAGGGGAPGGDGEARW
ncbi:MAG TPA: ATP-dependent Clp protease proteolytic subunit [Acidimicrobiales bacterium]|nr:ATP-dependent Clp protease proteolytic subunit [Acidimicrobiales bacterium]